MHTSGWVNLEYEEYLRCRLHDEQTAEFSHDMRDDVFSLTVILGTLFSTRSILPGNEYPFCKFYGRDWRPGDHEQFRNPERIDADLQNARQGLQESVITRISLGEPAQWVLWFAASLADFTYSKSTPVGTRQEKALDKRQQWKQKLKSAQYLRACTDERLLVTRINFEYMIAPSNENSSVRLTLASRSPKSLVSARQDSNIFPVTVDRTKYNVKASESGSRGKRHSITSLSSHGAVAREPSVESSSQISTEDMERSLFSAQLHSRCPASLLKASAWDLAGDSDLRFKPELVNGVRKVIGLSGSMVVFPSQNMSLADLFGERTVNLPGRFRFCIDEIGTVFLDLVDGLEAFHQQQRTHNAMSFENIFVKIQDGVISNIILANPKAQTDDRKDDWFCLGRVLAIMFMTNGFPSAASAEMFYNSLILDGVPGDNSWLSYYAARRRIWGEPIEMVTAFENILKYIIKSGSAHVSMLQLRKMANHWKQKRYHRIDLLDCGWRWIDLGAGLNLVQWQGLWNETMDAKVPSVLSLLNDQNKAVWAHSSRSLVKAKVWQVWIPGHDCGLGRVVSSRQLAIWADQTPDVFPENVGLDVESFTFELHGLPAIHYRKPGITDSTNEPPSTDSDLEEFKQRIGKKDLNAAVHILARALSISSHVADAMGQFLDVLQDGNAHEQHATWENVIDISGGSFIVESQSVSSDESSITITNDITPPREIKQVRHSSLFYLPIKQKAIINDYKRGSTRPRCRNHWLGQRSLQSAVGIK